MPNLRFTMSFMSHEGIQVGYLPSKCVLLAFFLKPNDHKGKLKSQKKFQHVLHWKRHGTVGVIAMFFLHDTQHSTSWHSTNSIESIDKEYIIKSFFST